MSKLTSALALAVALVVQAAAASAQTAPYPSRPIKLIVMSAAGGGADAVGRILADSMEKRLGQQIIVENKGGAGGRLAMQMAAASAPDGYTINLGGMTTHIIFPGIVKKLPYDPIKSFTQLGQIGNSPILMVADKDYPANNLAELAELAKREKLQYATWGVGSTGHLCMELFSQTKGVTLDHIPYISAGKVMNDIMGGHIKLGVVDMASGTPLVKDGKIKALATCTRRSTTHPTVGGYPDQGIPFDEPTSWSLHAPAGLPADIRAKLEAALADSLKEPEVIRKFDLLGITVDHLSGPEYTKVIQRGVPAWAAIAQKANISID